MDDLRKSTIQFQLLATSLSIHCHAIWHQKKACFHIEIGEVICKCLFLTWQWMSTLCFISLSVGHTKVWKSTQSDYKTLNDITFFSCLLTVSVSAVCLLCTAMVKLRPFTLEKLSTGRYRRNPHRQVGLVPRAMNLPHFWEICSMLFLWLTVLIVIHVPRYERHIVTCFTQTDKNKTVGYQPMPNRHQRPSRSCYDNMTTGGSYFYIYVLGRYIYT